ncbi:MAG: ribosome-associated ATPase/putative transporter RbbA [Lentisphaeria bacterium]|nr:ribosome-associated ATPase/putative transporter RbbA [Lentisphaeria bacterium]
MSEHTTPETGNGFVSLRNVTLRYGKVLALDNVTLDVPPGKLSGMIGPDGVGKSSMLSLITGARAVQEGKVYVLGGDIADKEHRERSCPRIAYMPQGLGKNLYFTLTVEENLQFFGALFGHNAAERRRRIDHLTRSTGLYQFLDRPAGKLSGGMKQKLGLCCSLIHDPDLLVLDEPTTGVDPLARRQFWDLIDSIRKDVPQMGIIVATAYMDEAQRFDHLIAVNDGKILATGSPQEILTRTGKDNLDAAFIQLLPEEKRSGHRELTVPPFDFNAEENIAIAAQDLTKKFGSFTAVDHVSFRIRQGEIFGFLGSNGCGKTTTMRMLCGLLPASEGTAELFGKPIDADNMETRLNLGYMTQLFSLYNELTVKQNLMLYARLCRVPEAECETRVNAMMEKFQLLPVADTQPSSLPLGIKQRLSLAAAVIHHPKILILDEPTSGVDPVARDLFWEMIIDLSRNDKVTIFVTTHFMNEAARCDRISLMHAGRSLACDTPEKLIAERNAATLEEAFIGYLEDAGGDTRPAPEEENSAVSGEEIPTAAQKERKRFSAVKEFFNSKLSIPRIMCCAHREYLELIRDPIRATLALFGALLMMLVMGFGINMDVEDLNFAVLDRDRSQTSNDYVLAIAGSRYFHERKPLQNHGDIDRRLRSGELSLAVEIPPDFGKDVAAGRSPEIAFYVDGAMPSRAETVNGYITALHNQWLSNHRSRLPDAQKAEPARIEVRYRYNPDVRSLPAMVPAVIPILLLMIPAILAALAVVREKETGSIINLYVSPLSRTEFMLGKQLPYLGFALGSGLLLVTMAVTIFDVPVKGSIPALLLALLLYSFISTAMGLLASSVTRSQIAVIFLTMLATILPSTQMCGMINPVSTQTGIARLIGSIYPTSYMLLISRGVFNKALYFADLRWEIIALAISAPIISFAGIMFLKKQDS